MEVLAKIRKAGITTPVMFLTARSEVEDRIAGLNAGADDYLVKPFAGNEFVARVKALTRRRDPYTSVILQLGNTELDQNNFELKCKDAKIRLNGREFQLLELFMQYPYHVFSTEYLHDKIWELDSETNTDIVWVYICFLRKRLKQINSNLEISTLRGEGYCLEKIK